MRNERETSKDKILSLVEKISGAVCGKCETQAADNSKKLVMKIS